MLVGKIILFIKTGRLLGRFFVSEVSQTEHARLKLQMSLLKSSQRTQLIKDILDRKQIEERQTLYRACDPERAWEQIQKRRQERQKGSLPRRYTIWARNTAAAVAVILLCAATIYYSHAGRQQRILDEIAQIRPTGSRATLYLADGRAINLQNETPKIEGVTVHKNTLEYNPGNGASQEDAVNILVTPRGGDYQLTLADGTRVWLNAASELRYFTSNNSRERLVQLVGEAYFEVAHDPKRPFIVESEGQRIRVTGTRFNVNTYDQEQTTCTTLVEGSVAITTSRNSDPVLLRPNQQAVSTFNGNDPIQVAEVDAMEHTAWMNDIFLFNRASITEIMRRLSRWYNFEYEIAPHLSDLYFSGQFQRYEDLDRVLTIITTASTYIKIDYDGKKIMLE